MKSSHNSATVPATEQVYLKQVIEGTLKLSAVILLTTALLIFGI